MNTTRRHLIGAGVAAAGTLAIPAVARAQTVKWRMVTSWPRRLPGPGMSAERVAERIRTLSNGRIDINVFAAGVRPNGTVVKKAAAGVLPCQ